MNTANDLFTVIHSADDADAQQRERSASGVFRLGLAIFFAIALGMLVWLIVSSSVADVSASARNAAAQPAPQVPYFPSLYVNQATAVEPAPPTF